MSKTYGHVHNGPEEGIEPVNGCRECVGTLATAAHASHVYARAGCTECMDEISRPFARPLAEEQAEASRGAWTPKSVAAFNALTDEDIANLRESSLAGWNQSHARESRNFAADIPAPTLRERFWTWLGFGRAFVHEFPDPTFVDSSMTTDSFGVLDWRDRLRVLVSGRIHIHTRTKTDVTIRRALSFSAFRVPPPGAKP